MTVTIAVVVPSLRRPDDLRRCLSALAQQTRPADHVVVVARPDDGRTRDTARSFADVELVLATKAGQVAALNAGLAATTCDVVAFTDDDAAPSPDWLARIERHFADATVGGVGGRDRLVDFPEEPPTSDVVGRVQWFGRVQGFHHAGHGAARPVDVLKGCNMSFRVRALRGFGFDERLAGAGAQVHNDLQASLRVRAAGWRLVYDPDVTVEHRPAIRPAGDDRESSDPGAITDAVHNETLALLEYLPAWRRVVFLLWATAVGTRSAPGLAQAVRRRVAGEPDAWPVLVAAIRGRLAGTRRWAAGLPSAATPAEPPAGRA